MSTIRSWFLSLNCVLIVIAHGDALSIFGNVKRVNVRYKIADLTSNNGIDKLAKSVRKQ